jgi:hypothetical protein
LLRRHVGASAPMMALLVAFRSGASSARAVSVVSVSDVMLFLLVGMTVRTIDHSVWDRSQHKSVSRRTSRRA